MLMLIWDWDCSELIASISGPAWNTSRALLSSCARACVCLPARALSASNLKMRPRAAPRGARRMGPCGRDLPRA
eukprot:1687731-Pyramimonas_sp.AAC.1